jgi:drug/metabolite transporter (DMT)-like permease
MKIFPYKNHFKYSYGMTSVTSNTILSSSSSLFTFALSMVFLREPYTAAKLLSIFACIGGVFSCGLFFVLRECMCVCGCVCRSSSFL